MSGKIDRHTKKQIFIDGHKSSPFRSARKSLDANPRSPCVKRKSWGYTDSTRPPKKPGPAKVNCSSPGNPTHKRHLRPNKLAWPILRNHHRATAQSATISASEVGIEVGLKPTGDGIGRTPQFISVAILSSRAAESGAGRAWGATARGRSQHTSRESSGSVLCRHKRAVRGPLY
jgi:hypothetical protein